jgi:hypothetical protein
VTAVSIQPEIPISPSLGAYLGLRRASRGTLVYDEDLRRFIDRGRLVPSYLDRPLRILITQGFLRLTGTGHSHLVKLTPTGHHRYTQLSEDRRQQR